MENLTFCKGWDSRLIISSQAFTIKRPLGSQNAVDERQEILHGYSPHISRRSLGVQNFDPSPLCARTTRWTFRAGPGQATAGENYVARPPYGTKARDTLLKIVNDTLETPWTHRGLHTISRTRLGDTVRQRRNPSPGRRKTTCHRCADTLDVHPSTIAVRCPSDTIFALIAAYEARTLST